MDDIYTKLAKQTFTKEYFLGSVRSVIQAMIDVFPEPLKQIYTSELLDRIMEVYADRYPEYLETQIEVSRQVYSEEEVITLLDIQIRYPWLHEKVAKVGQLSAGANQEKTKAMIEEISEITEAYFDELEEEAEAMADGKD